MARARRPDVALKRCLLSGVRDNGLYVRRWGRKTVKTAVGPFAVVRDRSEERAVCARMRLEGGMRQTRCEGRCDRNTTRFTVNLAEVTLGGRPFVRPPTQNLVPRRKRCPVTWSKRTSTTSSVFSGSQSEERSLLLHRLGPPGALPVNPGPPRNASSLLLGPPLCVGDGRCGAHMIKLCPHHCIKPEQKGSHQVAVARVAKATDSAIVGAQRA